jgi:hypothetical protein
VVRASTAERTTASISARKPTPANVAAQPPAHSARIGEVAAQPLRVAARNLVVWGPQRVARSAGHIGRYNCSIWTCQLPTNRLRMMRWSASTRRTVSGVKAAFAGILLAPSRKAARPEKTLSETAGAARRSDYPSLSFRQGHLEAVHGCQVTANETKVPIAVAIREPRRLARSRSLNDMCAELPIPERTGDWRKSPTCTTERRPLRMPERIVRVIKPSSSSNHSRFHHILEQG